jgi:hypothetical protein
VSLSGKDSDFWSPAIAGVWEGGDGNRGDRIARVGGLISDFSLSFSEDKKARQLLMSMLYSLVSY